jgi:L-ribulokinase
VAAGGSAGGHDRFDAAQARMTSLKPKRFVPDPEAGAVYHRLYALYRELHDTFGGAPGRSPDLPSLMKRLLAIREQAGAGRAA